MERGFEAVALCIGLHERVGDVGQVVDIPGQQRPVVGDELAGRLEQTVDLLNRAGDFYDRELVQRAGERRQIGVQGDQLLVALVQRVDEKTASALVVAKQITTALVQGGDGASERRGRWC